MCPTMICGSMNSNRCEFIRDTARMEQAPILVTATQFSYSTLIGASPICSSQLVRINRDDHGLEPLRSHIKRTRHQTDHGSADRRWRSGWHRHDCFRPYNGRIFVRAVGSVWRQINADADQFDGRLGRHHGASFWHDCVGHYSDRHRTGFLYHRAIAADAASDVGNKNPPHRPAATGRRDSAIVGKIGSKKGGRDFIVCVSLGPVGYWFQPSSRHKLYTSASRLMQPIIQWSIMRASLLVGSTGSSVTSTSTLAPADLSNRTDSTLRPMHS